MSRFLLRVVAIALRVLFYPLLLFRRRRAALPSGWMSLEYALARTSERERV
jgi:hypothetical protein